MEEMSKRFQMAHTASQTNSNLAIQLYTEELAANPTNFLALNNRGLIKVAIGEREANINLFGEGISDIEKAIIAAKEQGNIAYPAIGEADVLSLKQKMKGMTSANN